MIVIYAYSFNAEDDKAAFMACTHTKLALYWLNITAQKGLR